MLRPTLTDEGFVTEIHHVTGEGENKGVVYCEMQGRENSAESVAERACLGALYDKTGYASETGGICDNIRKLENKTIQRYHAEFYRAENLCLIVTGGVDPGQLLDVVDEALARSWPAQKVSQSKGLTRPWTTPVPPPSLPYAPRRWSVPLSRRGNGISCLWLARLEIWGPAHGL